MKSEHAAYLSLATDAKDERKKLKAKNMETIEEENQRKRNNNARFWHSIKSVVFVISCAAIAVYTLIHFAGQA
jgi:hypothetical protein